MTNRGRYNIIAGGTLLMCRICGCERRTSVHEGFTLVPDNPTTAIGWYCSKKCLVKRVTRK